MGHFVNRRRFMQATSSAVAVGALSSVAERAAAQSAGELRVVLGGGDWGKANVEAYVKPFEAETGIKVTPITDDLPPSQLQLMVTTKNVTVDVFDTTMSGLSISSAKGHLEKVDYSIYKKQELDGIVDFTKTPFGVASIFYSYVMVYNTEKFPTNKPRPTTWAEFWDVKKFPGVRALMSGQSGREGPFEEALLADGVAVDKVYPMDIDRCFASLDKIKPHIRKWWLRGSEIQQIMHDKAADIMSSYDGRAQLLVDQGAPIEINRNQAKLGWNYWAIPKGSPNVQNAQKFLEFATRADRQAAFTKLISYGPSNLNAYKQLPDTLARKLANYPEYMKNSVLINVEWYSEIGSDGLSNAERLVQRWNEWILR
ncbi:ABC transporter substrate-binding protein [Bradyrhizobium ganzhouense]|uniref:ABC transporter substrate-binding protein n=1 Tax=Bradyrhizobium ganzhouense TaxID=1179767 RepID=UPI003CE80B4A